MPPPCAKPSGPLAEAVLALTVVPAGSAPVVDHEAAAGGEYGARRLDACAELPIAALSRSLPRR